MCTYVESCTIRLPPASDKAPPKAAPMLLLKVEAMTLTADEIAMMMNALPEATLSIFSQRSMAHVSKQQPDWASPMRKERQQAFGVVGLRTNDIAVREIVHAVGDIEHAELL